VLLAWAGAGAGALILWGGALLPAGAWLALARRNARGLALAGGAVVAAWGVASAADAWAPPLNRITFWITYAALRALAQPVVAEPAEAVLGTPAFLIEIAPKCAGYQSVTIIGVFLGAYLWLCRHTFRFPHALLLLPAGVALAWIANGLRLAALVLVGSWVSPAVAVGGLHTSAGSLVVCAVALGVAGAARRAPFLTTAGTAAPVAARQDPVAAHLAPLLALVGVGMVTGTFVAGGIDVLYALRVLAVAGAVWVFRGHYHALRWRCSWPAVAAGAAAFFLWVALVPHPADTGIGADLARLPAGWAALWLVWRILGAGIAVPLAEELAFRGYLLRRLVAARFEEVPFRDVSWAAIAVSSLAFGAAHEHLLAGTLAGLLYAGAARHRGNLAHAVLAHATTNCLLAAYICATGTWSLW
jgi:exosortase E/protease (VPEID-CTERM system)